MWLDSKMISTEWWLMQHHSSVPRQRGYVASWLLRSRCTFRQWTSRPLLSYMYTYFFWAAAKNCSLCSSFTSLTVSFTYTSCWLSPQFYHCQQMAHFDQCFNPYNRHVPDFSCLDWLIPCPSWISSCVNSYNVWEQRHAHSKFEATCNTLRCEM